MVGRINRTATEIQLPIAHLSASWQLSHNQSGGEGNKQ
jgi:hypothetical protein